MCTRYGKSRRPQHYRCPEARGGVLPYGSQWRPQYCRENIGAYNTVCVREVAEYYSYKRTGYGPWYCGLICAPCLAFSVCSLVLSEQASPVGWSQSALVVLVGEER